MININLFSTCFLGKGPYSNYFRVPEPYGLRSNSCPSISSGRAATNGAERAGASRQSGETGKNRRTARSQHTTRANCRNARIAWFIVPSVFKLITPNIKEKKGVHAQPRGVARAGRRPPGGHTAPAVSKERGAGSPSNQLGLRESHRKPPTRAASGRRTRTRRRRLPSECALTPSAARCSPQGAAPHPSKVHSLNPESFRGPFKTTYPPNCTVYSKSQTPGLTSDIYKQDGRHAGRCDSIFSFRF